MFYSNTHTHTKEASRVQQNTQMKGEKLSWLAYATNTQQRSLSYVTKHTKKYEDEEAHQVCDGSCLGFRMRKR